MIHGYMLGTNLKSGLFLNPTSNGFKMATASKRARPFSDGPDSFIAYQVNHRGINCG